MIVYPALDLRGGKVVRLGQSGDPSQQKVYGDDPIAVAKRWIGEGARWLHVVNLDGALATANDNEAVVRKLINLRVPVQFGGGLRTIVDVARTLDWGVSRVILGTLAVTQPELAASIIARHGAERIAVALDARDGYIATHGWQQASAVTPVELGKRFAASGARYALYTNVGREGTLGGVDVAGTADLARQTGLAVTASGGVSGLGDVKALVETGAVAGVVLGTALYEGKLTLADALRVADEVPG